MEERQHAQIHMIPWLLLGGIAVVFAASMYSHLFIRDFDFLIETACDPSVQVCHIRDCEEDECPPNNLSAYRVLVVPANAFARCTDASCAAVCSEPGACFEIPCSTEEATCEGPGF